MAASPSPSDRGAAVPGEPRLKIALAWASLAWERVWRALWASMTILAAFVAIAWFGLPRALSGEFHTALLIFVAIAALSALRIQGRGFALPRLDEARRRLEVEAGLLHRPLETLRDRPTDDDPETAALWREHRRRAAASIGRLRVPLPKPGVIERDPAALRWLVALTLILAGAGAWGEWRPRLVAAVTPRPWSFSVVPPATLDAWLTPPEYTGRAPLFLRFPRAEGETGAISIPEGTVLTARVSGGRAAPTLEIGGETSPFDTVEPGVHQTRREIREGNSILISRGGDALASWPIQVVPDQPPLIALTDQPRSEPSGALRIAVRVADDHGVAQAGLRVAPAPPETEDETPIAGAAFEVPLPLPAAKPKSAEFTARVDLTAHPWAGSRVTLTPVAVDVAGRAGEGKPVTLLLPERSFRHPVARAIVDARRKIARAEIDDETAAQALDAIGAKSDAYGEDVVTMLTLRVAADRLLLDRGAEAVPTVIALLWDAATRLEDGAAAIAERDLTDVRRRLEEALTRDAPPEEIRALMDEMSAAMERWLRATAQNAGGPNGTPALPPEIAERMGMIDDNDLRAMMERMRSLAETGSRDAARAMLARLGELLDSARDVGSPATDQPPDPRPAAALKAARDLLDRQRKLLDDTFAAARDGDDARRSPRPGDRDLADAQEAIRRDLGDLARRLAEIGVEAPRGFARADRSMRSAARSIRQGRAGAAVPLETQAADDLSEGLDALLDAAAQAAMGGSPAPGPATGMGRDPLGRRVSGTGPNDERKVKLPTDSDVGRSREILMELRRRSEERTRPKPERDYIDRLLRTW